MNWKNLFYKTILDRGRRYYNWNAVDDIKIENGQCDALVMGSKEYQVSIWKKANYQLGMSCTCPYYHERSHGESFLALVRETFQGNGIYLLDEPEAALSPPCPHL